MAMLVWQSVIISTCHPYTYLADTVYLPAACHCLLLHTCALQHAHHLLHNSLLTPCCAVSGPPFLDGLNRMSAGPPMEFPSMSACMTRFSLPQASGPVVAGGGHGIRQVEQVHE